jgi:hypothetical protein
MVARMIDNDKFMPPNPWHKTVDYSPELERAIKARFELRNLMQKKEFSSDIFVNSSDDKDNTTIKN